MISLGASTGLASPSTVTTLDGTLSTPVLIMVCVLTSSSQHTLQPRRQPGMLASQEAEIGESQIQCLPGPWDEFKQR